MRSGKLLCNDEGSQRGKRSLNGMRREIGNFIVCKCTRKATRGRHIVAILSRLTETLVLSFPFFLVAESGANREDNISSEETFLPNSTS